MHDAPGEQSCWQPPPLQLMSHVPVAHVCGQWPPEHVAVQCGFAQICGQDPVAHANEPPPDGTDGTGVGVDGAPGVDGVALGWCGVAGWVVGATATVAAGGGAAGGGAGAAAEAVALGSGDASAAWFFLNLSQPARTSGKTRASVSFRIARCYPRTKLARKYPSVPCTCGKRRSVAAPLASARAASPANGAGRRLGARAASAATTSSASSQRTLHTA